MKNSTFFSFTTTALMGITLGLTGCGTANQLESTQDSSPTDIQTISGFRQRPSTISNLSVSPTNGGIVPGAAALSIVGGINSQGCSVVNTSLNVTSRTVNGLRAYFVTPMLTIHPTPCTGPQRLISVAQIVGPFESPIINQPQNRPWWCSFVSSHSYPQCAHRSPMIYVYNVFGPTSYGPRVHNRSYYSSGTLAGIF